MAPCCGSEEADSPSKHGKPRGCTDFFCLVLFLIFWFILIFLGAFAFVIGNPLRLVYGYDSFGNICGMPNEELGNLSYAGKDMTDKPFVFYLNMADIRHSLKICVKKCPDRALLNQKDLATFYEQTGSLLCRYDVKNIHEGSELFLNSGNATLDHMFRKQDESTGYGPCPKLPLYSTKPLMSRCVPETLTGLSKDIVYSIYGYLNSFDAFQQVVSDLYASWREILIMVVCSVGLAVIMVFLIHFLASLVAWIIMTLVSLASLAVTITLWWTYVDIKWGLDYTPLEQLLEESVKNERAILTFAIISTIVTVILLLIVFVLRKRVSLMVGLFRESGRCLSTMPCLLIQPLWTFVFLVLFFLFWMLMLVAMATAAYPMKHQELLPLPKPSPLVPPSEETPLEARDPSMAEKREFTIVSYGDFSWVRHMWWFHLLALIWISEFILACQQMVIAGAVSAWYFTRDRSSLHCPILKSISRLFFCHMGSVAMGSFLITLFKIPRLILLYLESKLGKYKDNIIANCCLKCCHCCLYCLEKFIRYLNHNAYTVVAITSKGFCTSAKEAFGIIVSNALRIATINSVGDFILFLGKCAVTAITAFIGILLMKHNDQLHFFAIPVFVGCVFAFFIAHCVLSVYEMVIDCLFVCFCIDQNENDGSPGKEYYAPKSLMKFLSSDEEDGESQPLRSLKAIPEKSFEVQSGSVPGETSEEPTCDPVEELSCEDLKSEPHLK